MSFCNIGPLFLKPHSSFCWKRKSSTRRHKFWISHHTPKKNTSRKTDTKQAPCSSLTMSLLCWVLDMMPLKPRGSTPHCTGRMSGGSAARPGLYEGSRVTWENQRRPIRCGGSLRCGLVEGKESTQRLMSRPSGNKRVFMVQNDD